MKIVYMGTPEFAVNPLKKLDENDVTVIIKGLKNIIFHFLDITEIQNNEIIKLNQNQSKINLNFRNDNDSNFNWDNIKNEINITK